MAFARRAFQQTVVKNSAPRRIDALPAEIWNLNKFTEYSSRHTYVVHGLYSSSEAHAMIYDEKETFFDRTFVNHWPIVSGIDVTSASIAHRNSRRHGWLSYFADEIRHGLSFYLHWSTLLFSF
jgi:hypothetical protein